MEQLEQIPIGQQPNDGTGDPLRNGMVKVNANFAKVQTGVDAVELTAMNAAQTATEAKTTADAAIPATQKGMAGGVAPLDNEGKVPGAHLGDYLLAEERGVAGGVAPLDSTGKVPAVNLPAAEDSIPLSQKGQAGGVATLDSDKKVPVDQLPPIPTGPPVGSVGWWPFRASVPAGQIPADGQTVSRATFPSLTAMVTAGTVPVVPEADWLADPLKRGAYTLGDGSTTIRLPDYNGKASGSIGALFMRGDGALSSGADGRVQRDALQNIAGSLEPGWGQLIGRLVAGDQETQGPFRKVIDSGNGYLLSSVARVANDYVSKYTFDASLVARTATETRPSNVAGVWTVQAFGAVTNPGSADAAQLASDYAVLNAGLQSMQGDYAALNGAFQTLKGELGFTILYPNGGTAAAPAPVAINSRYVLDNPFPGFYVQCSAQLRFTDGWCDVGWYTDSASGNRSAGTRASQLNGGIIVVMTGNVDVYNLARLNGMAAGGTLLTPVQSRVLVWKLKGAT